VAFVLCGSARLAAAANRTTFVVISKARSGSDFLLSLLNSHPDVCAVDEMLIATPHDKLGAYLTAVSDEFGRSADPLPRMHQKCFDTRRAWASKRRGGRSTTSAVGFKFFSGQCGVQTTEWPIKKETLSNETALFRSWLRAGRVKLLLLEREGLDALVSNAIKHIGHKDSPDEKSTKVATHCFDAACVSQVSELRIRLYDFLEFKVAAPARVSARRPVLAARTPASR
jgi:hypothetical protein